ncbi:MAG: hypothetical protein A3A73_01075 [Omnitrophica bacterium RIFCSPLOWO2_01_FULL_50_24]|nr:MAG: hypothetical protein A3A73_01075 [Omnitrophica bacterium RIFCSPLOWO2_01_FULL_50_24]
MIRTLVVFVFVFLAGSVSVLSQQNGETSSVEELFSQLEQKVYQLTVQNRQLAAHQKEIDQELAELKIWINKRRS